MIVFFEHTVEIANVVDPDLHCHLGGGVKPRAKQLGGFFHRQIILVLNGGHACYGVKLTSEGGRAEGAHFRKLVYVDLVHVMILNVQNSFVNGIALCGRGILYKLGHKGMQNAEEHRLALDLISESALAVRIREKQKLLQIRAVLVVHDNKHIIRQGGLYVADIQIELDENGGAFGISFFPVANVGDVSGKIENIPLLTVDGFVI